MRYDDVHDDFSLVFSLVFLNFNSELFKIDTWYLHGRYAYLC